VTCFACGKNNFNWARACAHCGTPIGSAASATAPEPAPTPMPDRELQLSLPEPESSDVEDRRAWAQAFVHMPMQVVMPIVLTLNVGVFVMMAVNGVPIMSPDSFSLQRWGANYGPLIATGEWWRLLTATFLHAGLMHLLFNMIALLSVGAVTERMFGWVSFGVLYLLSGLAGSVVSVYWHPLATGVGASGAIFGLYGGLFAYLAVAGRSLPSGPTASLRSGAAIFVLYNVVFGAMRDEVDMAAHLGGLVVGALSGVVLARPGAAVSDAARARRGWLVGVVGVALVAFAATKLPVFDDWAGAVRRLGMLEDVSFARIRVRMQEVTDGRLPSALFANDLEAYVIAPWQQHRSHIASLRLPSRERGLADKAVAYMDRRAAAWQLEAEAFRREDIALMRRSNEEQAAANVAGREFLEALGVKGQADRSADAAGFPDAGEAELVKATERLATLEKANFAAYNDALARARAGRLTGAALADFIESSILKPWRAELDRLTGLPTKGPVEGSRRRVEEYMRLRGEAWRLTARGIRNASESLMRQAGAAHEKASNLFPAAGAK
jgi:membrane associated rhomboid family serine protease